MAWVEINTSSIEHNARFLLKLATESGVKIAGVTKVVCGDPIIADKILKVGFQEIGESRLENVKRMKRAALQPKFLLLRLPDKSRYGEVVDLVDSLLISELGPLETLNSLAKEKQKQVEFIYMVDTGDLREGVMYYEASEELEKAVKIAGNNLKGIGTNLGCFGGVVATPGKFEVLLDIGERLKRKTGVEIEKYSAGNTASLTLLERDTLPAGINHYRIGEALMCGTDVTNNRKVPSTVQDTFTLHGEIIELKTKPSVPIGDTGYDAFGRRPTFEERGVRNRAILDLGEQDIPPSGLKPLLEGCEVIHASSDHLIVDITDFDGGLTVGDSLPFRMSYGALLRVMTSPYIVKEYV